MFVDYSGTKLQLIDRATGEVLTAELFVAVLGASSLTYAEATTRAFNYFDGVTAMIVSDNLKSGITKACFYEPNVNRTYEEMLAKHYKTAIVPARPRKPKDKASSRSTTA
jgi:transposase